MSELRQFDLNLLTVTVSLARALSSWLRSSLKSMVAFVDNQLIRDRGFQVLYCLAPYRISCGYV